MNQAQYTHFEHLLESTAEISPAILGKFVDSSEQNYIAIGNSWNGLEWFRFNNNGEVSAQDFNDNYLSLNPGLGGFNQTFGETFLRIPQQEGYVIPTHHSLQGCNLNGIGIASWSSTNENLDLAWEVTHPEWSICDTLSCSTVLVAPATDSTFAVAILCGYSENNFMGGQTVFSMKFLLSKYTDGSYTNLVDVPLPYGEFFEKQMRFVDDHYFVLSSCVTNDTNVGQFVDKQNVLLKINMQGEIVGELNLGNEDDCRETWPQMEVTPDGNILMVYEHCNESFDQFLNEYYRHSTANWALIDPTTMTITDSSQYSFPYTEYWIGGIDNRSLLIDAQNNVVSISATAFFPDDIPDATNREDHLNIITKFDNEMNIIWQNEYFSPDNGIENFYYEVLFHMIQTEDGGYLCVGSTEGLTFERMWLLKIDACGYEQPSGCPPTVGVAEQQQPKMQIWPNPFTSTFNAILPNDAKKISIIDATGRIVFEENVFYPNQTWNLSSLSVGVYVMSVQMENGMTLSERIVKR